MKKENVKANGKNVNVMDLQALENMLGVKLDTKKAKTTSTNDTEKKVVQDAINKNMHKFLTTNYPQFYKEIETQIFVTKKDENNEDVHKIETIRGNYLIFPEDVKVGNETKKGYKFMKPTLYCKGGKTEKGCFYKINGVTTFRDEEGTEISSK
tara:strand:- start:26 stop:484 length:459 start_codon:yes stop_codon:yes gene_type:complete